MIKKMILSVLALSAILVSCSNHEGMLPNPKETSFTVTIENIAPVKAFLKSGVFNTPLGEANPGPATPGKKYQFTIDAGRSQHVSFVTMLAATNDAFFGPDSDGIALYDDNGDPISGDVTDQVYLWDAGTEVNEEPAVGPNTVTNQTGPNTGVDENGHVLLMDNVTNGTPFNFPQVSEIVNVSVMHMGGTQFSVSIEDLSTAHLTTSQGDKPAPLSPGVWVVHNGSNPLYTAGMPDLGQGVEAIAEDGSPINLGTYVADNTGVTYPASPGVWVLHHHGSKPLFTEGSNEYGDGIEAIAEDGNATPLGNNISNLNGQIDGAVMDTPLGSSGPGAILPGFMYQFGFKAKKGDNLSFATMLAATNDIFFGTQDTGINLFNSKGHPVSGDVTSSIYLWDAGTEINEEPAIGLNTVTNQLGSNTGMDENQPVRLLSDFNDGFTYPAVNTILKVTITANSSK